MSLFVDIEKRLGDFRLKVQFEAGNETLALLGASGCGKSVTLRCIAGIEKPDRGKIIVDDVTLFDSKEHINLTPQKRCVGLLFQNYALFPNMTVLQNIRTGARREKNTAERDKKIEAIMASFGLTEHAKHYPSQLSGGQQQRTALARILVSGPNILLLDEPFSALDSHLRFRLEQKVRDVIHQFGKTVVMVSHDRDEVFRLSDKIVAMKNGNLETFGRKKDVFANPETRSAAMLTGCKNISRIEKMDESHVIALDWGMKLEISREIGNAKYIGIRMHDICSGPGHNAYQCNVIEEIENPFSFTIMLRPLGKDDTTPIGWELNKSDWQQIRAKRVEINLPPKTVVLLRG